MRTEHSGPYLIGWLLLVCFLSQISWSSLIIVMFEINFSPSTRLVSLMYYFFQLSIKLITYQKKYKHTPNIIYQKRACPDTAVAFNWSIAQPYFTTILQGKMYVLLFCYKRTLENKMATSEIKIQSFIRILQVLKS